jgi:FixJ family two-component response regulator
MNAGSSRAARRVSVAIVDDDASVRVSLKRLCEVFNYNATAYASGREFLESLDAGTSRADCLLLDAHMPEMTGFELQRRLVAKGVQIPTIVFTADDAPEVLAHYATSGIVAILRKPLASEALFAAIARAVGGSNAAP